MIIEIREILVKNPAARNAKELKKLAIYFNQFNLLEKVLANKNTSEIKSKLYKAMRYKSAKKDQFVFKYGMDTYLILS